MQTKEYFYVLNAGTGKLTLPAQVRQIACFSQFARIDYGFSDRYYLAAVTIRRDGSSRFGSEKSRYGYFPCRYRWAGASTKRNFSKV